MKVRISVLLLTLALLAAAATAQSEDKPSVALLSFGTSPAAYSVTETVILLQLVSDDLLTTEDIGNINTRSEIHGEHIDVIPLDAGWQLDRLNIMVDTALDRGADVLVAFTTPVAQAAINATLDMDEPPAVIFASVYYPFAAGLADAPCIKPDHVTGSQIIPPYEKLVELVMMQQPEITSIGTVFSNDQLAGAAGSRAVVNIAAEHGIEVKEAAVTHPVDFTAAVEGLISRNIEALILSIDTVTARGLPAIVAIASDNLIPIYYPSLGGISSQAMISAGYYRQYDQGLNVGRMVSAALRGDLDVAATAIDSIGTESVGIGVNLDVAAALEIAVASDIVAMADVLIDGGKHTLSERVVDATAAFDAHLNSEDRQARDRAYLASLECTAERIAEEQAELDAASE